MNIILGVIVVVGYWVAAVLGFLVLARSHGRLEYAAFYLTTIGAVCFGILYPEYLITKHYETFGMVKDRLWAASHALGVWGIAGVHFANLRRLKNE